MKLTEEQIAEIADNVHSDYYSANSPYRQGMIAGGIRAALALATQPEPPLKPWPKLPVVSRENWLRKDDGRYIGYEGYEAAAFALNITPRCVAVLRRNFDDFAERQAILAEIDAAGFDLPE